MTIKNLEKNCPVPMLHNIAEPDKAYDKCHHLLNPFNSNETFQLLSNGPVHFFRVFWVFFIHIQILIEHPVSKEKRVCSVILQSVASDLVLYYLSMFHKKNARLIWVNYFCCICYLHQLYCFSSKWIIIRYKTVLTIRIDMAFPICVTETGMI